MRHFSLNYFKLGLRLTLQILTLQILMIPSVLSYDEINQILVYQSEYGARVNI